VLEGIEEQCLVGREDAPASQLLNVIGKVSSGSRLGTDRIR